jgi:PAS domain S-box-containing protein
VTHPDEQATARAVHEALAGGRIDSHRGERRFRTKQGLDVWVELVVSAERDGAGRVQHLVAVAQDVSERKRTEAELGLVRRALEGSSDGVLIVSTRRREGEIVFVNPAFERITGYGAEEAVGRGWDLLGEAAADQPSADELCARTRRHEALSLLLRGRRKDGERYWSELRLAPVADARTGEVEHLVGVLDDVTERLGAVAERERLLGEAVSAREEAERAGRAKDEFLAFVSHELRSPLGVVASWLPMLRADARPELRERAAGAIERNVALLSRLIGDLLDASRIASGKLEIERSPFELVELVRTAVGALEPSARERGVALHFGAEPEEIVVVGDAERIEQVVHNLVDNAIKFTPEGGRIDVAVRQRGERVELEVRDTGEGIAPELLPTVFSRFRQGAGGPRGTGRGLGLGLAIVQHLAELHGGSAEAESAGPGCGTRVRVELPAALGLHGTARRRAGAADASLDGLCVLLLEPDRPAAEALALALEAAEAEVAWVRSAAEALVQGDALVPDVVVAAFDTLPEDAAELLAGLRAPGRCPRPPVAVALSTERTPDARRRAREAGFDAWLTRPFDPVRLIEAIRSLWRKEPPHLLVVDDDRDAADALALLLERSGFEVHRAYGAREAFELARRLRPRAVVTDLRLGGGGDGAALARALRAHDTSVRLIAATGSGRDDLGADAALFDALLQKPVALQQLLELLRAP